MVDPIGEYARNHIQSSRKRVFFTKKECSLTLQHLVELRKNASPSSKVGRNRVAAGKGVPKTTITEDILKTLQLVDSSSGPQLCRIVARGKDRFALCPVVPLEDLSALLKEQDQALGHPGYDVLHLPG